MVLTLKIVLAELKFSFKFGASCRIWPVYIHSAEVVSIAIIIIDTVLIFGSSNTNILFAIVTLALKTFVASPSWK